MTQVLQLALPQAQTNINASITQFLAWAVAEGKIAAQDEGQIIDTAATHLVEYVQASDTWTDAWAKVKAEFDQAQMNEWQKLMSNAIGELAAVIDQGYSILKGFLALIP